LINLYKSDLNFKCNDIDYKFEIKDDKFTYIFFYIIDDNILAINLHIVNSNLDEISYDQFIQEKY